MSHMLESHYLFRSSPAIQLKHRIFSFSVFFSLSPIICEDTRLLFALNLLSLLGIENPHSRDLHVLAPRLARGLITYSALHVLLIVLP